MENDSSVPVIHQMPRFALSETIHQAAAFKQQWAWVLYMPGCDANKPPQVKQVAVDISVQQVNNHNDYFSSNLQLLSGKLQYTVYSPYTNDVSSSLAVWH